MRHSGKILIADDIQASRDFLARLLGKEGYSVQVVSDGRAAMDAVTSNPPDLVLTDVMMPWLNGFDLCRTLKAEHATRLIPVILVTSLDERDHRLEGINAGADDFLTKPVDPHELRARVRSLLRLKRFTDDLDSAESVILSLARTVEARDPSTSGHCERMASYASAFGIHLGLSDEDVAALHRGGYLHDVGKVGVPDSVLLKTAPLTADEYEVMKSHTTIGDALCGDLRILRPVRPIVRHHHEKLDGSGYPDALWGDAIPLGAQIMGIVDVYDALTTDRVYRAAMSHDAACRELRREVDAGWRRADLVEEFVTLTKNARLRSLVQDRRGSWIVPAH